MVKLNKICKYAVAGCALAYILVYIFLGINHILYPFEIEVTEGQSVEQVRVLLSGHQFYAEPTLEFTPFIYTPFYYYVSAMVASVTGISFVPVRLVSFLSSLGCIFLIFLITKKQSQSKFAGIIAAGLYAATYEASGVWMDIARVDSLFLFLLLLTIYALRFGKTWKSEIIAGVLLSLCFQTKQTAAVIAIPLFAYDIIANKRRSVYFIGTAIALSGIAIILLNHFSDGWFSVYLLMPFQHEVEQRFYLDFWKYDIGAVFISCVFSLYYLGSQRLKLAKNFFSYAAIGMMAASWASRLHRGGWNNALFPAYAIIAILCGLGIAKLLHESDTNRKMAVYLMIFIQFAVLLYNPHNYIPAAGSVETGQKFTNLLASIPDPVFVPNHPYLLSQLGKQSNAHALTIWDFFRTKDKTEGNRLQEELVATLREKKYNAIILDNELFSLNQGWFTDAVNKYYIKNGTVIINETGFWEVSGVKARPQDIYVPNVTAT